jgi:glycosyltransferase involved in cell wall biosynthesis
MLDKGEYIYLLITPAKNEEIHLPKVAESVIGQTVNPTLWIIVDDGSTDNTPEIINKLENHFNWIKSIRLPLHPRDITFHYSYVCKKGFEYAIEFSNNNAINYNFIGLLDADTVLEKRYFEKLIGKFNKNNSLGIASGQIIDVFNEEVHWDKIQRGKPNKVLPSGTGRLWRKACFFETGGYPIEPAPDSISNVKAELRGWNIVQFSSIIALQQRQTSSTEGLWKGYKINGKNAYYLNKHPLLILLNIIYYSTNKPYYLGIAYLYGYLWSVFKHLKKIEDEEIKSYYWNDRIYNYLPKLFNFK